jgi:tRNA (cmo5U34)-methyltransferase
VRGRDRESWSEHDSGIYRDIAPIAVPGRDELVAALACLAPFGRDESFHALDLGCGDGVVAAVLLDCYPNASMTALDGSAGMRAAAMRRLGRFGDRVEVEDFRLASSDWLDALDSAGFVVSSLALHHLSADEKRALYGEIGRRISPHGALVVADIIEPQVPGARELFAATWDRAADEQSRAVEGGTRLAEKFEEAEWNYYRFPDPADRPSGLFEQLGWMTEAGFPVVDCFWMRAGHAVYGGYKAPPEQSSSAVSFESALESARRFVDEVV